MRAALVLRPAPGDARTLARLHAAGLPAAALPLFATVPVAWDIPAASAYDALLLTSANAVRHGGAGLDRLRALPVIAVGSATAAAARAAGFAVMATGQGDAAAAVALAGGRRLLHLAGADHVETGAAVRVVYASHARDLPPGALAIAAGRVALLHSARAAARFAALIARDGVDPATITLVGLSPAVLAAAGGGWASVAAAATPDDAMLVALAREHAIDPHRPPADKHR